MQTKSKTPNTKKNVMSSKKNMTSKKVNPIDIDFIARCELFLTHIGRLDQFRTKMMQMHGV